jgi:hypothetical protein
LTGTLVSFLNSSSEIFVQPQPLTTLSTHSRRAYDRKLASSRLLAPTCARKLVLNDERPSLR